MPLDDTPLSIDDADAFAAFVRTLPPTLPRLGRIPKWLEVSSMSRSGSYEKAAPDGPVVMLKCGDSTIVDIHLSLFNMSRLPRAEISPPRKKSPSAQPVAEGDVQVTPRRRGRPRKHPRSE